MTGPIRQAVQEKITLALKPTHLDIIDDSSSHAEHEAMRQNYGYTETHFKILVVSPDFQGKTPVQRHRMVYSLLNEELSTKGLHAVNIVTKTPEEYNNKK